MRRWLKLRLLRAMAPKAKDLEADLRRDREINPILASDHPYFHPLPDPRDEALAAHLHRRWQEHEAVVAGWSQPEPRPWDSLEPDQKRGYRAIAIAAREFLSRNE